MNNHLNNMAHLHTGKTESFDTLVSKARQPKHRARLSAHETAQVELRLILERGKS